MKRYAVADIGSNTVVLLIYEMKKKPKVIYHESVPVHLIGYHKDGHMQEEGIAKTSDVLRHYRKIIDEYAPDAYGGFVTEPWRNIDNSEEMLSTLNACGIPLLALSGREEAELDYLGTRTDCPEITDGAAFDIGGGSTEFISFHHGEITEAVSIPAGCVRLAKLPVDPAYTDALVQQTLQMYPLLRTDTDTLIGIGGTVRALRKVCKALHGQKNDLPFGMIEEVWQKLMHEDEEILQCVRDTVSAGRQPVFLPGVNMLMSVMRQYPAKTMHVSKGCVREGYLLRYLHKE